jgi:RHS repeat-associated protein
MVSSARQFIAALATEPQPGGSYEALYTGRTDYAYDVQGRQAGVTESNAQDEVMDAVRYWYDATGTRVGMAVEATGEATATTTYVIDHHNPTGYSQVLEERDASNEVVRAYTLGHDLIAQMDVSALNALDRYYFAYDGHGSTSELVGLNYGSLEALESYAYDAYGNLRITAANALLTTFLYSGEMTDAATGQQYLRARYYDPGTGRFNRLDPFAGDAGDPQSLHKYLYVHGEPIQGTDPTGASLVSSLAGHALGLVAGNLRAAGIAAVAAIFIPRFVTLHEFAGRVKPRGPSPAEDLAIDAAFNFIRSVPGYGNYNRTDVTQIWVHDAQTFDAYGYTFQTLNMISLRQDLLSIETELLAATIVHEIVHTDQFPLAKRESPAYQKHSDFMRAAGIMGSVSELSKRYRRRASEIYLEDQAEHFVHYGVRNPAVWND